MLIILIVLICIAAAIGAYAGKMQATTLYVGMELAGAETRNIAPRGFQDAITPKYQTRLQGWNIVLLITIIVLAFFIEWYFPLIALVMYSIALAIAHKFVPSKLVHYVAQIGSELRRRQADFAKENDVMRADAAEEFAVMIEDYLLQIQDLDLPVPAFKNRNEAEIKSKH